MNKRKPKEQSGLDSALDVIMNMKSKPFPISMQPEARPSLDPKNRWGLDKHLSCSLCYINLGNMTKFGIVFHFVDDGLFFAVVGKGSYIFNGMSTASYVEEKLNVMGGDAGNVADIINSIQGINTSFGNYYDHLCRSE